MAKSYEQMELLEGIKEVAKQLKRIADVLEKQNDPVNDGEWHVKEIVKDANS